MNSAIKNESLRDHDSCISREVTLAEFLVQTERLSRAALERALAVLSVQPNQNLPETLTNLGLIAAEDLADGIADYKGCSRFNLTDLPAIAPDLPGMNLVFYRTYKVLPLEWSEHRKLKIAAVDPTNSFIQRALTFAIAEPIEYLVGTAREIDEGLRRLFIEKDATPTEPGIDLGHDVQRLRELASDAPVIKFVDHLIEEALRKRASDIHLETAESGLRCRYRIDGILHEAAHAPSETAAAIISRIKIMSGLDIAERRMPQDGRMRYRSAGKEVDFRVATSPSATGEGTVIRLLDKSNLVFDFESLGFDKNACDILKRAIGAPHGIVLSTGPTGSGKTTTLYAALNQLNTSEAKILTIEDPVEYAIPGINQTQVEPKIGRTFAAMLRSFLRQDPDVIMVGEIRDKETAEVAIQASLTGHLVLSTLHTNDAASSITRLLDMGVEGYLISSTVRLVLAQRLVRKLCPHCREQKVVASSSVYGTDRGDEITIFHPKGCTKCGETGYRGRTIIAECLEMTDEIATLVQARADATEIQKLACSQGMTTMFDHGVKLAIEGQTSLDEVFRVTMRR